MPIDWSQFDSVNYATPIGLIAGAMLIFLNHEGFELMANASAEIVNPKKSLPIAYVGGVLLVTIIYILIVMVVVGHLSFAEVTKESDRALSATAQQFMGRSGFLAIAVAALLATSSAINATFYSTGRLTYIIAKSGQLPAKLERSFRGQHLQGTLITALLALLVANYGSVIMQAFDEVENTLSNEQSLARRLPFNESAVRYRKEAVRIASEQYMAGRKDLLWGTYLEDNLNTTQAELIKLHGNMHRNRIALLLALGDSFDDTPAATVSQSTDWP
jgi:hypothetical protein